MYLSRGESRIRLREAQNARDNRGEIVRALSHGQTPRRDLFQWGITRPWCAGVQEWPQSVRAQRLCSGPDRDTPQPLVQRAGIHAAHAAARSATANSPDAQQRGRGGIPSNLGQPPARRLSYHTDFTASGGTRYIEPAHRSGAYGGTPARRALCTSALGGVLSQGWLCAVTRRNCVDHSFHPNLPFQANTACGATAEAGTRAGPWGRRSSRAAMASRS